MVHDKVKVLGPSGSLWHRMGAQVGEGYWNLESVLQAAPDAQHLFFGAEV